MRKSKVAGGLLAIGLLFFWKVSLAWTPCDWETVTGCPKGFVCTGTLCKPAPSEQKPNAKDADDDPEGKKKGPKAK